VDLANGHANEAEQNRDAAIARAEKAEARCRVLDEANAGLADERARHLGEMDDIRARIAELEAFYRQVAEIVGAVHHQSMGPLIPGTPDDVLSFARDAVAERNAAESRLAALTAPVEGEPSIGDMQKAWLEWPGSVEVAFALSQWRAGHAAGMAKASPASGENATDHDLSEVWSRYSALLPTSLQAAARRALYDIGKAHGYREGVRANADRDADSRDAALIRAKTDASLRPIEAAIESARLRAEKLLGTRDLPRATDEELFAAYDEQIRTSKGVDWDKVRKGVLAVAARVRREQCLVTRAVESGVDLHMEENCSRGGWHVKIVNGNGRTNSCEDIAPSDVARVLAEMLGEVK
jgi:hypothetical protein